MPFLKEFKFKFDKYLNEFIEQESFDSILKNSMSYSINAGGKRLRPYLIYRTGEGIENNTDNLLKIGTAVEILHTSTLIHDDLPSIDDARLRRNKEANHIRFNIWNSILTGDYGFVLPIKILNSFKNYHITSVFIDTILKLFEGETKDVYFEKESISPKSEQLESMYEKKTGALFAFCFSSIHYLHNKNIIADSLYEAGKKFGIAFQIFDDIKDVKYSKEIVGKDTGNDANKLTLVDILGLKEAKNKADNLFKSSLNILKKYKFISLVDELNQIKSYIEKK